LLALATVGLVALVGCNKGTTGGAGADKEKENKSKIDRLKAAVRQPEDTFTLTVPTFSVKVKQGESKEVKIGIKKGKNFDEDVALKVEGLPKGVTLDPAEPVIKHGDKEVKLTVKAADDASLGDFTVKLTGHPEKEGGDATNKFNLTVQQKK
jgi:uncharacterized membrane protein